jgi:hypothetical protein
MDFLGTFFWSGMVFFITLQKKNVKGEASPNIKKSKPLVKNSKEEKEKVEKSTTKPTPKKKGERKSVEDKPSKKSSKSSKSISLDKTAAKDEKPRKYEGDVSR